MRGMQYRRTHTHIHREQYLVKFIHGLKGVDTGYLLKTGDHHQHDRMSQSICWNIKWVWDVNVRLHIAIRHAITDEIAIQWDPRIALDVEMDDR